MQRGWFSGERWLIFAAVQQTGAVIRKRCTGQSVDDANRGWQTPTPPPNPSCPTDLTSDVLHRAARQTLGHFSHAHILSLSFPPCLSSPHAFSHSSSRSTFLTHPSSVASSSRSALLPPFLLYCPLCLYITRTAARAFFMLLLSTQKAFFGPKRRLLYSQPFLRSALLNKFFLAKAKKLILRRCTNTTWTSCVASRERDA